MLNINYSYETKVREMLKELFLDPNLDVSMIRVLLNRLTDMFSYFQQTLGGVDMNKELREYLNFNHDHLEKR